MVEFGEDAHPNSCARTFPALLKFRWSVGGTKRFSQWGSSAVPRSKSSSTLLTRTGGAHVDSKVSVRYAMATEPPVVFGSGDGNFVRLNLARGSVAQAGSELLDYLTVHFRQHPHRRKMGLLFGNSPWKAAG